MARVSANVLEESTLGFIVTNGDPRSNDDNSVIGVDYLYRNTRLPEGRQLNASFWYQQSDTEGEEGDDAAYGLSVKSPNQTGWKGGIGLKEIQENFMPAVGFVSRPGIQQLEGDVGYTYQHNGAMIRSISAEIKTQKIDLIDGGLQSQSTEIEALELENNSGDRFSISYRVDKERLFDLDEPFEISDDIFVPEGTYSYGATELDINTGDHRPVTVQFKYRQGDFF